MKISLLGINRIKNQLFTLIIKVIYMPKKEDGTDKAFEAALKGNMGWKCACSLDIVDKKSGLVDLQCKDCGKTFKSNVEKDYCFDCEKKHRKT